MARCTAWMAERLADRARWRAWVAVDDGGAIVGTLWVELIEKIPNPTPEPEAHAYITNVYVRPTSRGGGIGTALLETALAWCADRGVHAAILWPTERSAALYRRFGFGISGALFQRELAGRPDRGSEPTTRG